MSLRACLFIGCVLASACDMSAQVGTTYVSSEVIAPATGGTITLDGGDIPELDGSSIHVPPGALAEPTKIGIGPGVLLASGDWSAIGSSVEWAPDDLILAAAADYAIPALIPSDREPEDVVLLVDGPYGVQAVSGAQLECDAGLLRFSAPWLGTFQAAIGKPCSNRSLCSAGNVCVHGGCRPDDDGM